MDPKSIFLITSGAYANEEIASDFGLLPTSFLPVGHKRLIELQLELISNFQGTRFVSVPNNYILSKRDKTLIVKHGVKIFRTDPCAKLSEALLDFLNVLDPEQSSGLFILHGDTLFSEIEYTKDVIYYGHTESFYKWGAMIDFCLKNNVEGTKKESAVISGFFTFSNIQLLAEKLRGSSNFERALNEYSELIPLEGKKTLGWLDFGHSNLYYKSKRSLNVTRNFNSTSIVENHIRKTSLNREKIRCEYQWYKQLPEELEVYTPRVWGFKQDGREASYFIEFIGSATLQEKFVFGNLPDFPYYSIIDDIFTFIKKEKTFRKKLCSRLEIEESLKKLYLIKTEQRLELFLKQIDFDPLRALVINDQKYVSLLEFKREIQSKLNNDLTSLGCDSQLTIMHGDLCFSNILYDSRSGSLKIIDPRGGLNTSFEGDDNVYGDYRYDIAKLGHSLVGNYDFIVAGFYDLDYDFQNYAFTLDLEQTSRDDLERYFFSQVESLGVSIDFIKASIANLFLSMLPLHNEDKERQLALLLNAYKVYYK